MEATIDDWKKLDIRIAEIVSVEKVPNKDKLYKLQIDLGTEQRQIVSSIVPYYTGDELIGKKIAVITNLKPAKFGGELSQGMLLAAENEDDCVLLVVDKDIPSGAPVH